MIKYEHGNLIEIAKEGQVDVIAHCANCFCTMGSGIAPQIKKNFPEAWSADLATIKGDKSKLGTLSYASSTVNDWLKPFTKELFVFNLYGQYGYGNRNVGKMDLDYSALESALTLMKEKLDELFPDECFIGLPMLGSGLAGGDWNIISQIIERTLTSDKNHVTVYVLDVNNPLLNKE